MKKILERTVIQEIKRYLYDDEIIVLHGARQVGKTSILYWLRDFLQKKGEKCHYIDLEDSRFVRIIDTGVSEFLKHLSEEGITTKTTQDKKIFVFIDEIQYLKNPSSFLKLIADHEKCLKLIVSGSSSFEIKNKFKDSLVGRTINFEIFNLSFAEFLFFKGVRSPLFMNQKVQKKEHKLTKKKTEELRSLFVEYVLYGGYPKIVLTLEKTKKEKHLQQIIDTYVKKDIRDLAQIKDIEKFNKLLEVLASQSGNLLNTVELSNTCKISRPTIEKYLFILEQTFVIKLLRPYHKNIRSEISKQTKIFFYDTGLMHLLWLKEFPVQIIGNSFESSIFSEIVKKYGQQNVFYWRTKDKREIDFILRIKNKILPLEAKVNFRRLTSRALKFFYKHYSCLEPKTVGLNGEKEANTIYPWEI